MANGQEKTTRRSMGTRRGLTMIELLVVVGIIMALSAVLLAGIGRVRKSAASAKAQDLVSNVATAMNQVLQAERNWPGYLIRASKGKHLVDEDACQPLISRNLFSLSYVKTSENGESRYRLKGVDRCGIVDPWAAQVLKSQAPTMSGESAKRLKVPGGGTVEDHILRFAIDDDYDGICNVEIEGSKPLRVRASVAVWSCGQNGKFEDYGKAGRVEGSDDVYSWTPGQVER